MIVFKSILFVYPILLLAVEEVVPEADCAALACPEAGVSAAGLLMYTLRFTRLFSCLFRSFTGVRVFPSFSTMNSRHLINQQYIEE